MEKTNLPLPKEVKKNHVSTKGAESSLLYDSGDPLRYIMDLPLSSILLHARFACLITDQHHHLIWANDTFINEVGRLFPEVVQNGANVLDRLPLVAPFLENGELAISNIRNMAGNFTEKLSYEAKLVNGKQILIDHIPVFSDSLPLSALWIFADIAGKKPVEDEIRKKRKSGQLALGNLNVGFVEFDLNGNITRVYDGFCQLTGYQAHELIGKNITETFVPPDLYQEAFKKRQETMLQYNHPIVYEMEIIAKDGSRKWALTSSANLFDGNGNIIGGIEGHMDITPQKSLQQELEKSQRLAEESKMALQQFIASMSHEIRTPLNTIIGMSHLLADTKLDHQQKEYVHILRNSSNILLGLISDILDFSKIESGNMEVQHREFDLIELVLSLTNTFQFKIKKKPVQLNFVPDEAITNYLIGDDILLNQVLLNLLSNAEKFTHEGHIDVTARIINRENDMIWIEFKVKDTGIGIGKDELQLIFQDFKQANKEISAKFGGTGLGLSISKKLIELQGGRIMVESKPGEGSCFSFTLPFHDTGTAVDRSLSGKEPEPSHLFSNAYLLIVEDNPMNLTYITTLLEKLHVSFDIATNGWDALEVAAQQAFDLILMDIKIPGIEGLEVAKMIRSGDNPNNTTPIVLTTAVALQSTVNLARENEIDDLLPKPFTPEQLLKVLNKYISDDEREAAEAAAEQEEIKPFAFSPKLDVNYLVTLYENNVEYATGLFGIFLDNIRQEWGEIRRADIANNLGLLCQLVHKVKPNFSMVGLTWISHEMEKIEASIKKNENTAAVPALIIKADKELQTYLPVIEEEYQRLLAYQAENPQ